MKCPICKKELPELDSPDHYDKNQWMFSTNCGTCGTNITVSVEFLGDGKKDS